MNKLTANDMAPALKEIGHDLSGIPSYRIEDGRILISILDNEEGEGEETIEELRRNLPEGAAAEWTGNSDTSGDGEVTRDCEITWATDEEKRKKMSDYLEMESWDQKKECCPPDLDIDLASQGECLVFHAKNEVGDVTSQVFQNGWVFTSVKEAMAEWLNVWRYYVDHPEEVGKKLHLSVALHAYDGSYGRELEWDFAPEEWPVTLLVNSDFENEICIEMQDGNDFEYFPNGSLYGGTKRMFSFKGVLLATDTTKTQGNSDEDPGFPFGLEWEDDWKNRVAAAWRPLDEKEIQMIEQCVADNRLPGEGATEKELLETYGGPDDEDELGRPYWLLCSAPCREFEYRIALEDGKGIDVS